MAVLRTTFLDRAEEDLIHEQTLRCLSELGVRIRSPGVLQMLADAGADVDLNRELARIPESLVHEALRKAPRRIRYCARDPFHDFEIPAASYPYAATNGLAVHIADLNTGEDREPRREDLAAFTRLADALEPVDYVWTSMTPVDVPSMSHGLHELWITLQNTVKHVEGITVLNGPDARAQIALAALVAGGEDELRRRPILSVVSCPTSPLSFDRGPIEAQVEFAKAGVPILSMSMSLGGMSSPVTLAGTLTNINAENLASLVIDEVAAPGAPHIYASDSTPVNMQTGYIDYAAVETPLIAAGAAQMARRYGLPCMVAGWGASVAGAGLRMAFSELSSVVLSVLSGTDLSAGMGGTDIAKGCSYEQLVLDASLWEHLRAFMRAFTVSEQTIALEVMKSVGHGNSFLRHPHTVRNFRKELFFRNAKTLAWEATLSDRMVPEAREVAKRLLREHEVPSLDGDILRAGEEMIRKYEEESTAG